jgi:predicted ATPase/transcriptional regulator with XRE-family HTH domain
VRETTPVGELLTRWRHAAGLTQAELARRAAVSERALRDLERGGTSRPRVASLRALADALELDGARRQRLLAAGRSAATGPPGPPPETRLGPLVGRDAELARLRAVVVRGPHRLITVTGPGGVGKSRLVARVAADVERRADLAVQSVDVGRLDDAATFAEVLADAVGARGRSRLDPVARIAATLGDRRLVLLLDGFERVRAAAPVLRELVARCPGLTLLVTSRVPLLVGDEHELPLGPLPVPRLPADDLAAVAAAPAMALLLHVGAAVRPDLALTPDTAGPLVAVCRAVDGLPLALELAAARLRLLSPAELAARLDRPLAVLGDGPVTLPERHRSLRATIESSLELVGPEAAELLVRLVPFPAGVALPDLEAVAHAAGPDRVWLLRGLGELAAAGLLRVGSGAGGSRYRLPDPVHELAAELLDARADAGVVRAGAARHHLRRLAAAGGADGDGPGGLREDEENMRAALLWAGRHEPELVDRAVVDAFYRLCELTGRFHQGWSVLAGLGRGAVGGAAGGRAQLVPGPARRRRAARHRGGPRLRPRRRPGPGVGAPAARLAGGRTRRPGRRGGERRRRRPVQPGRR